MPENDFSKIKKCRKMDRKSVKMSEKFLELKCLVTPRHYLQ